MNRRKFLRALAAIPLVGSVPALAKLVETRGISPDETITPATWFQKYYGQRMYVNGVDRTDNCFLSNPAEGWALCAVPVPGKPKQIAFDPATGEPKEKMWTGRVEIRPA